jgi:hypothetical protein
MKSSRAQEQEQWLHRLQSLSKKPIRVSKNCNGKPSQWIFLEDALLPVDYRTVLHNEVVIDIDATRWKDVRLYAEMVQNTLNNKNIPYITAYTGGRGIHLHFFFSLSEDQKMACQKSDVMPQDLRMWLFYHILQTTGISPKLIGPGNPFDTSVVNWSDEGKGHLIRIFGGKKRTYKTVLLDIPEERQNTGDITFPDDIELWTIPDSIFKEFIDNFRKSNKKRVEACKRYQKASQNFSGKYVNLPCVQKILEGVPEGQRNAGAHILAIAARLDGLPQKEAQKVMLEYADNCSKDNITESEYLGWVEWIFKEKPFWNCRFCKELELCEEGCKFHEAAFKDVLDFLKDPELVKKIDEILGKRIKKDRKNRMLVFFVCLSAYGSSPLNLFLKGESSIGKTHIAKSVAEYFPEEDVWFIGDMSPKALVHEHGTFENGKVYISLENKILVFMETPRRETLEMLKPILSHDRTEIEYKIADKRASGQLGTKTVIIKGWPSTIFCSTDHKYLEELSTRSMVATPETSSEKIAEVLEYKGEKYVSPWVAQEDENEVLLRKGPAAAENRY